MKEAKVYYYVTLCTKDGTPSLWQPGTAADLAPGAEVPLSEGGLAVEKALDGITEKFEQAAPEKYVVMPNHVHIVLALERGEGQPDASLAKVVSSVAAYLKRWPGSARQTTVPSAAKKGCASSAPMSTRTLRNGAATVTA